MDEPTGGLDTSVQARLLDLLRVLVRDLGLAAVIVTHDLAVARLLTDRLMMMKYGAVVEDGLTDQALDDPQHAYTQLLTSGAGNRVIPVSPMSSFQMVSMSCGPMPTAGGNCQRVRDPRFSSSSRPVGRCRRDHSG